MLKHSIRIALLHMAALAAVFLVPATALPFTAGAILPQKDRFARESHKALINEIKALGLAGQITFLDVGIELKNFS